MWTTKQLQFRPEKVYKNNYFIIYTGTVIECDKSMISVKGFFKCFPQTALFTIKSPPLYQFGKKFNVR